MATNNLSRDRILEQTEQGFLVFLKLFPELIVQRKYGIQVELTSPFRKYPGRLNVYFNEERGKWFFGMGKGSKIYGDIFGFFAHLYKLDYKRDFAKITKIIEKEMLGFDVTVLEETKRIQLSGGEWLEVEAATDAAGLYEKNFVKTADVSFPLKAVSRFKSDNCKSIKESDEHVQYLAVEAINNQLYYVFDSIEFHSLILGNKPINYFFGFEQAIRINFFLTPASKPNLILCSDPAEVITFNYLGIPAIHVQYDALLEDAYFQKIIAPTFSNMIATSSLIPREVKKKYKIKVFDVTEFLAGYGLDIRNHCLVEYDSDGFLEPLWKLYSHIDDDRLTI